MVGHCTDVPERSLRCVVTPARDEAASPTDTVVSVTGSRPGQNLGFRRSANPLLALAT
jgi:hypothetical protein